MSNLLLHVFINHLLIFQELGVNCIELMPCHEFNELEYYGYNSVLGDYKYDNFLLFCNFLWETIEDYQLMNISQKIYVAFYITKQLVSEALCGKFYIWSSQDL